MSDRIVRFGIIGAGMMGRHFVSACNRWTDLLQPPGRPRVVAVCNRSEGPLAWFRGAASTIEQFTSDYRAVLANPAVDAVYVALPHAQHEEVCVAAIEAGKHVMIEKPCGIDRRAAEAILNATQRHPGVFVRCASQFPFFPAAQRIGRIIEANAFGTIIEVETGLLHCSDLDPNKPINWKRTVAACGEYGVLGDLGMHACHVPLRAGWRARNVRAVLSNLFTERPDGSGATAPCNTWDHATLLSDVIDPATGQRFPWTLRTSRISPGAKNSWYVRILGTRSSARFSTENPKRLDLLDYVPGGEQAWRVAETGSETAYPTITGGIFEFGFADAILQMWAAFINELLDGPAAPPFARCLTVSEAVAGHALFTAALESQRRGATVAVASD